MHWFCFNSDSFGLHNQKFLAPVPPNRCLGRSIGLWFSVYVKSTGSTPDEKFGGKLTALQCANLNMFNSLHGNNVQICLACLIMLLAMGLEIHHLLINMCCCIVASISQHCSKYLLCIFVMIFLQINRRQNNNTKVTQFCHRHVCCNNMLSEQLHTNYGFHISGRKVIGTNELGNDHES